MKITETGLAGVKIIEPDKFEDSRGFFMEIWQNNRYTQAGITSAFVQDNIAFSTNGVLRGLHFQNPDAQAKMVYALSGEVFDVIVDIRYGSPTFGQWTSVTLDYRSGRQIYIPEGFAHGYCVISDSAIVAYKCSNYYNPKAEGSILWSDPDIGIDWPIPAPLISEKDTLSPRLKDISPERLPQFSPE